MNTGEVDTYFHTTTTATTTTSTTTTTTTTTVLTGIKLVKTRVLFAGYHPMSV